MKIEKFWLVLRPEPKSELGDILYKTDINGLALQFRGGQKEEDIIGAYTSKNEAEDLATAMLKIMGLIGKSQ